MAWQPSSSSQSQPLLPRSFYMSHLSLIVFLLQETLGTVVNQGLLGRSGPFSMNLPLQSPSLRRSSRARANKMTGTPS